MIYQPLWPQDLSQQVALLVPSDRVDDWPFVAVLSPNLIESNTEDDGCSKENATPIHINQCGIVVGGKEAKEHSNCRVSKANNVYERSKYRAHVPWTPAQIVLFGIITESFAEEESDRDHV
jgi:hypothetical protein